MADLHVWHDQECEWYVAESLEHLGELYEKQTGDTYEACTGSKLEDEWIQCPDDQELTIWCTADGEIACEDDSGIAPVKRTMREWADRCGAGMLCSSEH